MELNKSGYVYATVNPAADSLVKIGKTTRTPEERVKELSAATGVPQPFILVYSVYFTDCTKAEDYIHTKLQSKRISSNKEFFRISPTEAINTIIEAQNIIDNEAHPSSYEKKLESTIINKTTHEEDCEALYENANDYLHGYGDCLRDEDDAIELFNKAINLGCNKAYYFLGEYFYNDKYLFSEDIKDLKQSLKYFKEGVDHDIFECWKELAKCYTELEDYRNADKCWVKVITDSKLKNMESKELSLYLLDFIRYMNNEGKRKDYLLKRKTKEIFSRHLLNSKFSSKRVDDDEFLASEYESLLNKYPELTDLSIIR